MEEVRKALQACRLFRELPEEGLETLAGLGRRRRFGRGALLIEPQETVDWFGVVLSGRVLILQMFCWSFPGRRSWNRARFRKRPV